MGSLTFLTDAGIVEAAALPVSPSSLEQMPAGTLPSPVLYNAANFSVQLFFKTGPAL